MEPDKQSTSVVVQRIQDCIDKTSPGMKRPIHVVIGYHTGLDLCCVPYSELGSIIEKAFIDGPVAFEGYEFRPGVPTHCDLTLPKDFIEVRSGKVPHGAC